MSCVEIATASTGCCGVLHFLNRLPLSYSKTSYFILLAMCWVLCHIVVGSKCLADSYSSGGSVQLFFVQKFYRRSVCRAQVLDLLGNMGEPHVYTHPALKDPSKWNRYKYKYVNRYAMYMRMPALHIVCRHICGSIHVLAGKSIWLLIPPPCTCKVLAWHSCHGSWRG